MELLRTIRRRPGLFLICILATTAPILVPLLIRGVVFYFVGLAHR